MQFANATVAEQLLKQALEGLTFLIYTLDNRIRVLEGKPELDMKQYEKHIQELIINAKKELDCKLTDIN